MQNAWNCLKFADDSAIIDKCCIQKKRRKKITNNEVVTIQNLQKLKIKILENIYSNKYCTNWGKNLIQMIIKSE